MLEQVTVDLLAGHDAYRAVQALPGIGPVLGAVIVAEIGDITRFRHPARLHAPPALGAGVRRSRQARSRHMRIMYPCGRRGQLHQQRGVRFRHLGGGLRVSGRDDDRHEK